MLPSLAFLLLHSLVAALPPQQPLSAWQQARVEDEPFGISVANARTNANYIFNSVHAAMRQWDSSLQHNGMSYFLATVPKGTLLYHGTDTTERVKGMEWLAFEIEHAEQFAQILSWRPKKDYDGPGKGHPREPRHHPGSPLGGDPFSTTKSPTSSFRPSADEKEPAREPPNIGYLHVYQTNRDLSRLLYIDGMSAGKTPLGTLDSTDYVLVNSSHNTHPWSDGPRARELCKLGKEWKIEGFLRMEAGFEIVLCDFQDGLDFVSATQRPINEGRDKQDLTGINELKFFEYLRALSIRYHGIDAGRVEIDYSSMHSAYFYPLNLSNPNEDTDQTLPRLLSADVSQLSQVKNDLEAVLSRQRTRPSINWQGIVDMIVTRYADRLQYFAADPAPPYCIMVSEINALLNAFIDYSAVSIEPYIAACTGHFLRPVNIFASTYTEQDKLIYAAIETVTGGICRTLFDVRQILLGESSAYGVSLDTNDEGTENIVVKKAVTLVRHLMSQLNWPVWKLCTRCDYDQVCYVAIWPWGDEEDHYSPRCKNNSEISERNPGPGYWHDEH